MLFVSVAPESVGVAAATLVGPPLIGNGADRPRHRTSRRDLVGQRPFSPNHRSGVLNATTAGAVQFNVLGPLELNLRGTKLPLGTPKQRAVLAMLLLSRDQVVAADALVQAIWEKSPPARARRTVHTYICNLRRTLSDAGVDSRNILVSEPPGYRLLIGDRQQCDLDRFVAAKESGLRASAKGYFSEAIRYLDSALQNWRGPVLGDLRSFMFVQMFSRALTEDELLVHTKLAEAAIACGRADVVIPKLERLVAMHPYRESLWKQLMLGYYVNEYQSAAIDAYHRLKSTLAEELGVEPAPTIRALYHKILRQLPMDDLVGRVTRGRVDLRGGNGAKVEELTESDKDLLPIGLA